MARRRSTARLPVAVMAAVAVRSTMAASGSPAESSPAASSPAGSWSAGSAIAAGGPDKPAIRSTEYGIPHIIASDWEGLGTGYGYAAAKDNVCAPAETHVNMDNLRALNTWFHLDQTKDVNEVVDTLETTQGVPFFNTVASDREGNALYADIQATANITDERAQSCLTLTGRLLFNQELRLPNVPPVSVFDPLSFPRVRGDAGAPRSLRTQELILNAQNRINGTDGLPGRGFTPENTRQLLFADNSRVAGPALDATVAMCRSLPFAANPNSPHQADQTRLFSAGRWVTERFTEDQIAASTALEIKVLA
nr:penicillin acylase family protein [Streptomyces sp. NRRL F-2747]